MNRYTKYIAAAVVLLVLVAVIACEQEAAPSTGTAAPTAAAVATTQPADGATPSTSAGATTGTTSPTAQVATTQPAEATAAPTGSEATSGSNQGGSRLETVRNRGHVVCASRNDVPGYGSLDDSGNNVGFDIDLCRALAAAVLGDPNAIEIRLITAAERGPTIQSGEVDMLVRTVTWTSSRDAQWGNYAQTMFYDGQGFLISKDLGITSALELRDATVCVTQGTTTELNLQDFSNQNDLDIAPLTFEDTDAVVAAYESGQCDAFTNDRSQLAAFRSAFADRDAHVILPETISEEPLGPVVPHGDDQWFDIVKTTMAILIYAEAYGVTSATVPASATGATAVDRMLGFDGSFGQETLGLSQTVAQDVISAVGNYGEIYDRNLGPGNVNLPRENGRNALWADAPCTDCPKGGQIYAAPLR
jgi:general L-amino acid transport system substrate-binding protein